MDKRSFGRQIHGEVVLDLCWDCRAIWFDQHESAQLAPGAVIELFRLIHEHRDQPGRGLAERMACPHCKARLALTHDVQRTNRLVYHRCPAGHGRLTGFVQFLREKQFIRSLSQPEVERLKATVAQVRCTGCGAPVDVARDTACPFCRAPLSVLDATAVQNTLAALSDAERRRTQPDARELAAAFESLLATHRKESADGAWTKAVSPARTAPALVDLVVDGIGRLFER